jgi:hypothetical protein
MGLYYVLGDIFMLNFLEIKSLELNETLVQYLDLDYLKGALAILAILGIESVSNMIDIRWNGYYFSP